MINMNKGSLREFSTRAILVFGFMTGIQQVNLAQELDLKVGKGLLETQGMNRSVSENKVRRGNEVKVNKKPVEISSRMPGPGKNMRFSPARLQPKDDSPAESREVEVYRPLIAQNPEDASSYASLAYCYYKASNFKESILPYQQALQLRPFALWAYQLGHAQYRLGRYRESVEALKQAVAINPEDVAAHYGLALAYYALGEKSEARNQLELLQTTNQQLANQLRQAIGSKLIK